MKNARPDQRRVTLRYLHDAVTGRTTVTIDVEVPEEDMPHEHRRDLREMAEELLGVPLGALPEGVEVNLRPAGGHVHGPGETPPRASTREPRASTRETEHEHPGTAAPEAIPREKLKT